MTNSCAACRRAARRQGDARAICASCAWTEARTPAQATAAEEATPPPSTALTALTTAHVEEESEACPDEGQLRALFGLAALVGEKGSAIVERVLFQIARGNARAYRVELNRLAAKYIDAMEQSAF